MTTMIPLTNDEIEQFRLDPAGPSPQLSASVDTGDQPIDTGLDVIPEKGKEPSYRGEAIADIVFPVLGGIAGGVVSAGAGIAVGAAAGKGLQGAFEKVLFEREKKLFPKTIENFWQDDSILGNMVKEGIFTAVGGPIMKVGGKVLKPLSKVGKSALKPFEKALSPSKFAQTKGGPNTWQKTVNWLQGVVDEVPEDSKEAVIRNMARSGQEKGVPFYATKRVLDRGPKNILTPENLAEPRMTVDAIEKASNAVDDAFTVVREEFEKKVAPILDDATKKIDLTKSIGEYSDDLSEIAIIKRVGKKGKVKLTGRTGIDDAAAKQFEKFESDIRKFSNDNTLKHAHDLKKSINKLLKAPGIKDNDNAKPILYKFHKGIRDKIDKDIPQYKNITDEYRVIFDLEDSLKPLNNAGRVEQITNSYFSDFKSVLSSKIDKLASKSDKASKALNNLLDQRAAKYFISTTKGGGKTIGVPFTKGLAGVQVGAKSPSGFGKSLIGAESRGFRTAAQRGLRGGADVIMGQEAGRVTGSSAPELRRLLRSKEEGGR